MALPDDDQPDTPPRSKGSDALLFETKEPGAQASDPQPLSEPKPALCPRCGNNLINPGSIGWCSKCGYCRSIEEEDVAFPRLVPAARRKSSLLGARESLELFERIPAWVRILFGGAVVLCLLSAVVGFTLGGSPFAKAVWSSIQLVLGLVSIFGAQIWALILIAPHDESLSTRDVFVPGRIWGHTFRRLPEMHRQVWVGAWGATASLCALFLIGGLDYWFQYYRPKRLADKDLVSAVSGGEKPSAPGKGKAKDGPDTRPLAQCVIIGFNTDSSDRITSLFLAAKDDSKLVYVGQVKKGITEDINRELLPQLRKNIVDAPFIHGLTTSATWVTPKVYCEVHQDGYDELRHLKAPSFANILRD